MIRKVNTTNANKVLPPATSELYEVVNWENRRSFRVVFNSYGEVDLRSLSVKKAEYLLNKGFPYLKKKKKAPSGKEA